MLFAPSFRSLTMKNKADLCRHLLESSLSCTLPFIMASSALCCFLTLPGCRTNPQTALDPSGFEETAGQGERMLYSVLFPRAGITPASGCRPHNGGVLPVPGRIKVSSPTAPLSASPPSPSRVHTHWPIATKSKKAERSQKYRHPFSFTIRGDRWKKEAPDHPIH